MLRKGSQTQKIPPCMGPFIGNIQIGKPIDENSRAAEAMLGVGGEWGGWLLSMVCVCVCVCVLTSVTSDSRQSHGL